MYLYYNSSSSAHSSSFSIQDTHPSPLPPQLKFLTIVRSTCLKTSTQRQEHLLGTHPGHHESFSYHVHGVCCQFYLTPPNIFAGLKYAAACFVTPMHWSYQPVTSWTFPSPFLLFSGLIVGFRPNNRLVRTIHVLHFHFHSFITRFTYLKRCREHANVLSKLTSSLDFQSSSLGILMMSSVSP